MRPPQHPLLRAALGLPASIYGAAVWLRNRRYDRPGAARQASLPVISVGNLTVGGTGKTPIVAWLARHLSGQGHRPAVVSRGYHGRAGRGPLTVSDGDGPRCGPELAGDEPYLLARSLPGVPVIVGSDRAAGARAARDSGADVVILDDGLQHRQLARDLDIVLLDASNPFGNYRLLPAGLLREPISALGRAGAVVITRSRPGESFEVIERVVRHHNPAALLLSAGHRSLGFFDPQGTRVDPPRRAVAFCGIGNPNRFRIDLESEGVELEDFVAFRDHQVYTPRALSRLRRRVERSGAALVTTEKDLSRMGPDALRNGPPLLVYRIEAELFEPRPLLALLRQVIAEAAT